MTLKELFSDAEFHQLGVDESGKIDPVVQEDLQRQAIEQLIPKEEIDRYFSGLKDIEKKQKTEEERQFKLNIVEPEGLGTQIASGIEGLGHSALAGAPEALERVYGGEGSREAQEGPFSAKSQYPQTYELTKFAGNFVPLGRALKIGQMAKAAPSKIMELGKEGFRLGAVYGGASKASENVDSQSTPEQFAEDFGTGATVGAPLGAVMGMGAGAGTKLASKFLEPNVQVEAQAAQKRFLEALKQGVEMYEKRGAAAQGEFSPPTPFDFSKIEGAVQRGVPLVHAQNRKIKNFDEFREATATSLDKSLKGIDKDFTAAGNKGVEISGDELAMDNLKSIFPEDFLNRLNSVQKRSMDETLTSLLKFRNKEYGGAGLEGLARMVLSKKGPFPGLSPEGRTALVNTINKVSRSGEKLNGEVLFRKGLEDIYPVDISMSPEGISALADSSRRFSGKQLKPWEVNDRIKEINSKLDSYYSMKPTPQRTKGEEFEIMALEREGKALRKRLYDAVSSYPGEMQEKKLDLGALMELNEASRAAGVGEKLDPSTSGGWRSMLDRASKRQNSLIGAVSLTGVKGNKDLTPSERLKLGFKHLNKSQRGRQPQSAGSALVRGFSKQVKSSRPVTREVVSEDEED